jgi:hypothetical protein
MSEGWFQLWLGFMFLLGGVLAGLLLGVSAAAKVASAWVTDRMPKIPEFIAVENIVLHSNVSIEDSTCRLHQSIKSDAPEITSAFVEQWLDKRDLMMSPKGKDYQVKAPAEGGGHAPR